MFDNRIKYQIARLIKFNVLRKTDKTQNLCIMCDKHFNIIVVDLKNKKDYIKKGYCVMGYYSYYPHTSNLDLECIVEEVFEFV